MSEAPTTPEPPVSNRTKWFRRIRIAVSVFFGLLTVALCVLWVRSYAWSVWIYPLNSGGDSVEIGGSHFGTWFTSNDGMLEFSSPRETFPNGWLFSVPCWLLVLMSGALTVFPWICWSPRLSLRVRLIATTLVAIMLGLVVWMVG